MGICSSVAKLRGVGDTLERKEKGEREEDLWVSYLTTKVRHSILKERIELTNFQVPSDSLLQHPVPFFPYRVQAFLKWGMGRERSVENEIKGNSLTLNLKKTSQRVIMNR